MYGVFSAVPRFSVWGHFPPFHVLVFGVFSAVPRFSVWGYFPPFPVLVYGVFSAVPPFHVLGSPLRFTEAPEDFPFHRNSDASTGMRERRYEGTLYRKKFFLPVQSTD